MAQTNTSNEFDAAKTIVETLKGLQRPQQERALRFASETLGLINPSSQPHLPASSAPGQVLASQAAQRTEERPVDIKQFTESKAPKSDQQFAAVVAYYYQFEAPESQRKTAINASVLADAARLANRRRPTRHALANAKRSGYLDASGSGEYKVNTVGENLVAITLPGNAGDTTPSRTRSTRKTKKKKRGGSRTLAKKTGKRK
jgi:hypothetical protein